MDYRLITPITIILRLLETSVEFHMVLTLLNKKTTAKKFLLSVTLFTLLMGIAQLFVPQTFCWIVTPIIAIPIILVAFKTNWISTTFSFLLTIIIVAILDIFYSFVLINFFNFSSFTDLMHTNYYYLDMLLISSSIFLFSFIIKFIKKYISTNSFVKFHKKSILTNTLLSFTCIFSNIFVLMLYFDKKTLPLWIIFVNIASMILMFTLSFYNTNKNIKLIRSEQRLEYQRNYSSTLQHLVDSLRTFKHDYENTLQTLSGYAQIDKFDKIKTMLSQVVKETKTFSNIDVLNPDIIKNTDIYAIVNSKYKDCIKDKVDITFDIKDDLENINMEVFDLTRILGIFLDNAIYASAESSTKKLIFTMSKERDIASIKISNSYKDVIPSNEQIFEKGFSTKGTDRGLGLYEVKKVLSKYPKATLLTTHDDEVFSQELLIPIY